ncbi:hypothetical protein LINPERHAP2_LOCUS19263 [Linum perenne]
MRITALTSSIRLITPSGRLSFHDDDDDEELCSLFDKEQGVELKTAAINPAARRREIQQLDGEKSGRSTASGGVDC